MPDSEFQITSYSNNITDQVCPPTVLRQLPFWALLCVGLAFKIILIMSRRVTFGSDEAVIGLMAGHILQGAHPIFYYGQSYMGSLDAYLTAVSFSIMGSNVAAIRVVQTALYLATLATTYALAYRITKSQFAAAASALLLATPPVLFSVYTTSTLGNYVEILLLNNIIWIIGFELLTGSRDSFGWWFTMGLLGGVGWWSLQLIIVSVIPLIGAIIWRFRRAIPIVGASAFLIGGLIGASAWWIYALTHIDTFGFLLHGPGSTSTSVLSALPLHLLVLVVFNLPALIGLRPSWAIEWILLPVGVVVAGLYTASIYSIVRRLRSSGIMVDQRLMLLTLLSGVGLLIIVFLVSPFGEDPSGRYLLPLYPICAVVMGIWLERIHRSRPRLEVLSLILLGVITFYNLWGNIWYLSHGPGLTTQFSPVTHIPNEHDSELIDFLDSIHATRGYSNYWVTFRIAFLTDERILLSPRLPYKEDLSYSSGDDRYPAYTSEVRKADRVVYVTSNLEPLNVLLRRQFKMNKVDFQEKQIGPYTVFYDLSIPLSPEDLSVIPRFSSN